MERRKKMLPLAVLLMVIPWPTLALQTSYSNLDWQPYCQPDKSYVADPSSPWQCVPPGEEVDPNIGPAFMRAVFNHHVPIPDDLPYLDEFQFVELTIPAMPWLGIDEIHITPGNEGDSGGLALWDVLTCGEGVCNDPNVAVPNIRGRVVDGATGITVDFIDDFFGDEVIYRLPNGDVLWFKYFHWTRGETTPAIAIQSESFDSVATAAAKGWTLHNGEVGWGWQKTDYAGGSLGEARASSFTAGTQRWYADLDLGGELTFTEDWQASGRMDFNENSVSDGGLFFGFFNRDTSLAAKSQTLAGFLLVNGQLTLRFERRPYNEYIETADFGLWVNDDRSFTLSYDADGGGLGIGRLTATLTRLADKTSITKSLDINHSIVSGATLNSFGFYAMDFAPGRYTPVGWAVDNLRYGPPVTLKLQTSEVGGCRSLTGTVRLSTPAPVGGQLAMLSDTLASTTMPATVTIPEGATSRTFTIKTMPVEWTDASTVRVSVGGATAGSWLKVRPMGLLSLTLTPTTVVGSNSVAGTAKLECKAAEGPVAVHLWSSNWAVANPVVASIVVPQGLQSAPFNVTTTSVLKQTSATIYGRTYPPHVRYGITKSTKLTVKTAASLSSTSLRFGNQVINTTSRALSTTLYNKGAVPYSILGISLGGASPQYYSQTNNCPASLNAGASCTITIRFTPAVEAYRSARVVIATSATSVPIKVLLTGTGIPPS